MNEIAKLRAGLYKSISKLVDYPYDDDVKNMNDYLSYMISIAEQLEKRSDIYKGISGTAENSRKLLKDIERLGNDHFQAEYVSTFELGQPTAACPLYSREYSPHSGKEDDLDVLNEITQIYEQYGLDSNNETPDFLPVELEFAAFLITKEKDDKNQETYFKAQFDFIETHLLWVDDLYQHVKQKCRLAGYVDLIKTAADFISMERMFLGPWKQ
ncbi:MAG: molecular chaperone TorD family protein [Thermodesulfobacteriota bacterium]|nr:molecular chaperone TorD family protein [Thermodesulfobacteriota bacterium]